MDGNSCVRILKMVQMLINFNTGLSIQDFLYIFNWFHEDCMCGAPQLRLSCFDGTHTVSLDQQTKCLGWVTIRVQRWSFSHKLVKRMLYGQSLNRTHVMGCSCNHWCPSHERWGLIIINLSVPQETLLPHNYGMFQCLTVMTSYSLL